MIAKLSFRAGILFVERQKNATFPMNCQNRLRESIHQRFIIDLYDHEARKWIDSLARFRKLKYAQGKTVECMKNVSTKNSCPRYL